MTTSSLREEFARLGPIRAADPVLSGSLEIVTIGIGADIRKVDAISAMLLLRRGGLAVLRAKRTIEAVLAGERIVIEVPRIADAAAFVRDMRAAGFGASIRSHEAPNVRVLRDSLGLTQEQFATRFGMELDAVRNWEHGRRAPDAAARTLLRVIAHDPEAVRAALDGRD